MPQGKDHVPAHAPWAGGHDDPAREGGNPDGGASHLPRERYRSVCRAVRPRQGLCVETWASQRLSATNEHLPRALAIYFYKD